MIEIHTENEEQKSVEWWIEKSLTDLFWFSNVILSHKKKEEYRDLNHIHLELCDFLDYNKNPVPQKLIEMSRDSLKSTIMRAFVIQQFLRARHYDYNLKIGLVTRDTKLSKDDLNKIGDEILKNELIQAFFYGYVPRSKDDAESWTKEEIRYKGIEIDIGSVDKSLTGFHYDIIINDNFCDEKNTATADLRKKLRRRWGQQESIIKEGGWELVFETPWENDDVSGAILDPGFRFNYESLKGKSPKTFVSKTGYAVFSCPVRNEKGELNFPERLNEKYLARKRRKQGMYVYSRMYDLQVIPDEAREIKSEWITSNYYDEDPHNYIRNLVIDCSGTTATQSTPSAISLMDTDENGVAHIPYAEKRKVDFSNLDKWLLDVVEMSEEQDKRPITFIGVEKEKFGIALCALLDRHEKLKHRVYPIDIRGRPRKNRIGKLMPLYEFGKIKSKRGLKQYEEEAFDYYEGTNKDVGILDTIFYQIEIQLIPQKMPKAEEFKPIIEDGFTKQVKADLEGGNKNLKEFANANF